MLLTAMLSSQQVCTREYLSGEPLVVHYSLTKVLLAHHTCYRTLIPHPDHQSPLFLCHTAVQPENATLGQVSIDAFGSFEGGSELG